MSHGSVRLSSKVTTRCPAGSHQEFPIHKTFFRWPLIRQSYTFWDYFRDHWQRNAGLRLDHLLVSKSLRKQIRNAGVDAEIRGKDNASDHAPTWVDLKL